MTAALAARWSDRQLCWHFIYRPPRPINRQTVRPESTTGVLPEGGGVSHHLTEELVSKHRQGALSLISRRASFPCNKNRGGLLVEARAHFTRLEGEGGG